jgi:hypothetical protein
MQSVMSTKKKTRRSETGLNQKRSPQQSGHSRFRLVYTRQSPEKRLHHFVPEDYKNVQCNRAGQLQLENNVVHFCTLDPSEQTFKEMSPMYRQVIFDPLQAHP